MCGAGEESMAGRAEAGRCRYCLSCQGTSCVVAFPLQSVYACWKIACQIELLSSSELSSPPCSVVATWNTWLMCDVARQRKMNCEGRRALHQLPGFLEEHAFLHSRYEQSPPHTLLRTSSHVSHAPSETPEEVAVRALARPPCTRM